MSTQAPESVEANALIHVMHVDGFVKDKKVTVQPMAFDRAVYHFTESNLHMPMGASIRKVRQRFIFVEKSFFTVGQEGSFLNDSGSR